MHGGTGTQTSEALGVLKFRAGTTMEQQIEREPPCGCIDGTPGRICDRHVKEMFEETPVEDRWKVHTRIFGPHGSARYPVELGLRWTGRGTEYVPT